MDQLSNKQKVRARVDGLVRVVCGGGDAKWQFLMHSTICFHVITLSCYHVVVLSC